MNYKFADLFCGGGGMSIGLINAGFIDTIAADFWDVAKANYLSYEPLSHTEFYQTNMFIEEERKELSDILSASKIDLLAGGPPCQGFMVAKKATEQMERQANQLTPRIQMPAGPFKAKAQEYISNFIRETNAKHENEVMEKVILALERDFCVSKQAAKIRLVELGIEAAIGTYTYLDNHYVKPHIFRKGSLRINQTFSLSAQDAAVERFVNPELRQLTESGDYLFLDNHFVYNAPLYVAADEHGRLDLTDYARSHMDECCLIFDMKITSQVVTDYHTVCFLNRESSDITFEIKFHNGYQNAPQERQIAFRKRQQAEWLEVRKQMTDAPEQCMELLLNWRGITYTELGAAIGRDPKTISRTVNGQTAPSIETVVRICFRLHLPPTISEKLLEVLRCPLKPMDPNHQWIKEALYLKYPEPLEAVEEYLEQFGVKI